MDSLDHKMQNRLIIGSHRIQRDRPRQVSLMNSYSSGKVATVRRPPAEVKMRELVLPGQEAAASDHRQPRELLFLLPPVSQTYCQAACMAPSSTAPNSKPCSSMIPSRLLCASGFANLAEQSRAERALSNGTASTSKALIFESDADRRLSQLALQNGAAGLEPELFSGSADMQGALRIYMHMEMSCM